MTCWTLAVGTDVLRPQWRTWEILVQDAEVAVQLQADARARLRHLVPRLTAMCRV